MKKLNIGCGSKVLEGYLNCDIIAGPGIDLVAGADCLPFADNEIDEILAEHVIEHLTFFEANRALYEWFRVLKPGGVLEVECPDLMGLCEAFIRANEYQRYQTRNGHWPIINHIYGHQRGRSESEILSQVHKSGYTNEHLRFMLSGIGFSDIEERPPVKNTPGSCVLRLRCVKKANEAACE